MYTSFSKKERSHSLLEFKSEPKETDSNMHGIPKALTQKPSRTNELIRQPKQRVWTCLAKLSGVVYKMKSIKVCMKIVFLSPDELSW